MSVVARKDWSFHMLLSGDKSDYQVRNHLLSLPDTVGDAEIRSGSESQGPRKANSQLACKGNKKTTSGVRAP